MMKEVKKTTIGRSTSAAPKPRTTKASDSSYTAFSPRLTFFSAQNLVLQTTEYSDFRVKRSRPRLLISLPELRQDEQLLAAAETLTDPVERKKHLRRLFQVSSNQVARFVVELLEVDGLPALEKNQSVFPEFSRSVAESMLQEVEHYAGEHFGRKRRKLPSLHDVLRTPPKSNAR